ncbi:uncharacterized protein EI90DRAFT_3176291 [Cantharellus anzutake]|uniref:uncharacterized protein n=1 Tax=Cantharellus anzutake TaxID=1750568 RepID=UPI001905E780|nr:uncharacterized protein EI90DRAFT_3177631 [Cantharellus anzutake]XP_038918361.1 uncharacterized protein EI90DRAFT_3176291 [Cantharellus anzutake]KAF8314633.1 hypothetical protein EI90DRAFT_3177631 [Cantharellus anzutake]KAF8334933.1 hypothetical protein EI90DRAFT_3176291 [Cantharellus anzutake]
MRFYVRNEYNELDAFVEEQRQSDIAGFHRRRPILLVGQPGIGKAVYLTHCLLNRLAQGKLTVLSKSPLIRFAFLESGVYMIPNDSFLHWRNPELSVAEGANLDGLVLSHLASAVEVNTLLQQRWRILVASSSEPEEVERWARKNNPNMFYMKRWSWQKVCVSR